MKKIFLILPITLLLVNITYCSVRAGTFTISAKSVGVIRQENTLENIGSAFIASANKYIITCYHVAHTGGFIYKGVGDPSDRPLILKYVLPKFDLSVFKLKEEIETEPLKFGDIKRIRPGDQITYLGWDKNASKIKVHKAYVFSIGSSINNGKIVEFIEFYGKGIQGYSGGPVFNMNGEVIGIMREAWTKKGIRGKNSLLVNRAFSTDILKTLFQEIHNISDSNLPLSSEEMSSLVKSTP